MYYEVCTMTMSSTASKYNVITSVLSLSHYLSELAYQMQSTYTYYHTRDVQTLIHTYMEYIFIYIQRYICTKNLYITTKPYSLHCVVER